MERRPNVRLKMLLFERDIRQKDLAFQINEDPPKISDAIRYGITTPELRRKIARALGVNEVEIFPQKESNPLCSEGQHAGA
jgi:ribosome-binding protein aMBF1 (putative translation factor)